MIKTCLFCDNETICTQLHTSDFEEQTRKCRVCQVKYEIVGDTIIRYSFHLNNNLVWSINLHNNTSNLWKTLNKWEAAKLIKRFDFVPQNITPINAQEKLSKYLTFL